MTPERLYCTYVAPGLHFGRSGPCAVPAPLAKIRAMTAPRLTISPHLAEHMAYRKFGRRPVRVLILESHYWVDQACAVAAEQLGWQVSRTRVTMQGHMSRDLLQTFFHTLMDVRPDFILSVNLSGMDVNGMLAAFFADLKVPHATWFVDDPRTILMGRTTYASPYAVALTWEAAYTEYLENCGFAAVHTLPLALDDTLFNRPPADSHEHPPTFVANSMVEYSAREQAALAENPGLRSAIDRAFAAGRVTRERFALGVDAVLGPGSPALDVEGERRAEMVFFIEGTRRLRHELVTALAPEGLHVRGDHHWQSVTPQWGPGLRYTDELAPYYRGCPVNINGTSVQMATAVNQRVFDCPAAGGFLLTDRQSSLDDLFDVEKEVATYGDTEEAREQLRWFMAHPAARREITVRAQARILGEHTYRHRLKALEALLRARFGGG